MVGAIGLNMVLNSAGFKRSLQNIQSQTNAAGQKMAASFKKIGAAIAATFSAKMIASFGKSCIDLGSDLAEVQNVVDVVFASMSESVNKWAKNSAKSYGLSETIAKKYVGLYGAMADASGLAEQQVYDMSTALTGLVGDVASFYNISQDEAYTKLKSVFSGETETLKDLGIVMTEDALNSYALANGINKTVNSMTQAEKVTLRYKFITNQLSAAQGDFARTSNAWANQVRVLSLRFDSLKATIGQGLINAFTPVIKVLNLLVDRLTTVSEKFKSLTEQVFGNAGSTSANISDTAGSVSSLTDNANESSSALDGIAESAEKAKKSVAGFDKLNIIAQNTSVTTNNTNTNNSTPSYSNGENSPLVSAMENLTSIWNAKSKGLIDSVKSTMGKIKTAISKVGSSWSKVWNNGTGQKFLENIKNLIKDIIGNVGSIADAFTKAWDKAGLGDSVIQSFIDKANSLIGLIDVIARDFGEVWNNGTGEKIWGNILTTIRNCNNATKTLRDRIKVAWENNDTGKKIWGDILGIVEDISGFMEDISEINLEWLETLDLSPIMTSVEKLTGAFRDLLKACGDKLKTAYKNILLPLAKWTIEKAVPKLVEMLANALKAVSNVVKNISDKALYAIAGGIGAVGTAVIIFKAGTSIAAGITKIKDAISLFLSTISANPLLAIASAIGGIVEAVIIFNQLEWSNSEAGKFAAEIDKIRLSIEEDTAEIQGNLEETIQRLDETYADNTLIDSYQEKLTQLLEKAELTPEEQTQLETIVTYFENNITGFKDTWDEYIKKSGDGTYELKTDLETVQAALSNTIDEYQKLANVNVLSELQTENAREKIKASTQLSESKEKLDEKQKEVDKAYKEWQRALNSNADAPTINSLEDKYRTSNEKLAELKKAYNENVAAMNKLTMTGDDLSDVFGVLNGDYSDAAAVMMAYKAGMISLNDVQESQWQTLDKLEKAASDTGKNTVLGIVEGTEEYKGALIENSNGLANLVLSEYDKSMGINSPSKEMYSRGAYTIEGLVNGLSDTMNKIREPLKNMVDVIKNKLEPIKNVFSNIFSGIWSVIRNPLNSLMDNLERFINGFISAINSLSSGADWAINSIGQIFGQDWHVGKLDKVTLPRFAKGAIVKAPTLAVVGDNAGAGSGNPEVISPLNKLQGMIDNSHGYDLVVLEKILDYLKRIYEMFVIFRSQGGNVYEFVAQLNESEIFRAVIHQNELYKKAHNGKGAF